MLNRGQDQVDDNMKDEEVQEEGTKPERINQGELDEEENVDDGKNHNTSSFTITQKSRQDLNAEAALEKDSTIASNSSGSSSRSSSKAGVGGYSADCSSVSNCSDSSTDDLRSQCQPGMRIGICKTGGQNMVFDSSNMVMRGRSSFSDRRAEHQIVSKSEKRSRRSPMQEGIDKDDSQRRGEERKTSDQQKSVKFHESNNNNQDKSIFNKTILNHQQAIVNPVDPRIDLTSVNMVHAKEHNPHHKDESSVETSHSRSTGGGGKEKSLNKKSHALMNAYSQLLDSCRPFFNNYPVAGNKSHDQKQLLNDTFNSGSLWMSVGTNGQRSVSSGLPHLQQAATKTRLGEKGKEKITAAPSFSSSTSKRKDGVTSPSTHKDSTKASTDGKKKQQDDSDASSMVVLARVKRKYQKEARDNPNPNNASAHESVGNSTDVKPPPKIQHNMMPSHPQDARDDAIAQQSLPRSISTNAASAPKEHQQHQHGNVKNEGSSLSTNSMETSSSSSATSRQNEELLALIQRGAAALGRPLQPPIPNAAAIMNMNRNREGRPQQQDNRIRVVSDAHGSSSMNTGGSGSGTGSGNDTYGNKKMEQNSAESNSGGDGKSSKNRSFESIGNDGHAAFASLNQQLDQGSGNQNERFSQDGDARIQSHAAQHSQSQPQGGPKSPLGRHADSSTQERLAIKKRKRMDKRREYEEEVQRQLHHSSSDSSVDNVFMPGEYISLEDSLSFSNTARLLLEGTSPFLAVHVNAAFSRLTGLQNTNVLGRRVSNLLTLVELNPQLPQLMQAMGNTTSSPSCSVGSHSGKGSKGTLQDMEVKEESILKAEYNKGGSLSSHENAAAAGVRVAATEQKDISIERLIASNGFSKTHVVQTINKNAVLLSDGSHNGSHDNNSSISSKDLPINPIICTMSVCPVMKSSSAIQLSSSSSSSNKHHTTSPSSSNKRQKRSKQESTHAYSSSPHHGLGLHQHKRLVVSHFIIQLFPRETGNDGGSTAETIPANVGVGAPDNGDITAGDSRSSKQRILAIA